MGRTRWPFLAALVVVLISVGVWTIVPRIEKSQRDRQAKAAEAQAEAVAARFTAEIRPAVVAVGRARLPGVKACRGSDIAVPEGLICANSSVGAVKTTVTLKEALIEQGATGVTAKCLSKSHAGTFCRLTGRLLSQPIRVVVSQAALGKAGSAAASGSFVAGGIGPLDGAIPGPSSGTPITLPTTPP